MNEQDKYDEDLLRKFINPERMEKAPDGFTSKTLTRIQIEAQSARIKKRFFIRNRVPLISAVITIVLIIAAITIPANGTESVGSTLWKYFQDLKISLPRLDNTYFGELNLPVWIKYTAILLFILAFLDRALSRIFRRESE
jgi:hypothetical protein